VISVVCFRWRPPAGYRSDFGPEAVNVLQRAVARHYPSPHRFICATDDPKGLSPDVEVVKLWDDFASVTSPHGWRNPSCYRRLRCFKPDIAKILGERFIWFDLDTVICGDLSPIIDRPEDFVIWGETDKRSWYNGSMCLMTAGARPQVYNQFNPRLSPHQAKRAGKFGSDQGWISYILGPGEATWTRKNGVYSWRVHLAPKGGDLPPDARVVHFHGSCDPWSNKAQNHAWIREHWAA
jgi:hypothetical protein